MFTHCLLDFLLGNSYKLFCVARYSDTLLEMGIVYSQWYTRPVVQKVVKTTRYIIKTVTANKFFVFCLHKFKLRYVDKL